VAHACNPSIQEADFEFGTSLGYIAVNDQTGLCFFVSKNKGQPGLVLQACNLPTWEVEAEGLHIQGQPGLHNKTYFQKKPINQQINNEDP
jgi:hypothetical protein